MPYLDLTLDTGQEPQRAIKPHYRRVTQSRLFQAGSTVFPPTTLCTLDSKCLWQFWEIQSTLKRLSFAKSCHWLVQRRVSTKGSSPKEQFQVFPARAALLIGTLRALQRQLGEELQSSDCKCFCQLSKNTTFFIYVYLCVNKCVSTHGYPWSILFIFSCRAGDWT